MIVWVATREPVQCSCFRACFLLQHLLFVLSRGAKTLIPLITHTLNTHSRSRARVRIRINMHMPFCVLIYINMRRHDMTYRNKHLCRGTHSPITHPRAQSRAQHVHVQKHSHATMVQTFSCSRGNQGGRSKMRLESQVCGAWT